MSMTDLEVIYNIIVQYLNQKQQQSKFASCKPRYIFGKHSYVCRISLAYHVSVCIILKCYTLLE